MTKSKQKTRIPTHEEVGRIWTTLTFMADSIMTVWQGCETEIPSYLRQVNEKACGHALKPNEAICHCLETVQGLFPDRGFNPALEVVMEILGSEERMAQFTPEQQSSIIRDAAIHATQVVYHLHLRSFGLMRLCSQFESGKGTALLVKTEHARFEQLLDMLMPRRTTLNPQ